MDKALETQQPSQWIGSAVNKKRVVGLLVFVALLTLFFTFNRLPKVDIVEGDLAAVSGPEVQCFQGFCIDRDPDSSLLSRWWSFSVSYLRIVTVGMVFAFLVAGLAESSPASLRLEHDRVPESGYSAAYAARRRRGPGDESLFGVHRTGHIGVSEEGRRHRGYRWDGPGVGDSQYPRRTHHVLRIHTAAWLQPPRVRPGRSSGHRSDRSEGGVEVGAGLVR